MSVSCWYHDGIMTVCRYHVDIMLVSCQYMSYHVVSCRIMSVYVSICRYHVGMCRYHVGIMSVCVGMCRSSVLGGLCYDQNMSFIDKCNHSSFQNRLVFNLTMYNYHSTTQNVKVVDQKTPIFVKKYHSL